MHIAIKIEQPNAADLAVIHAFLAETYWSPGVPRDVVARAASNSICAIARDEKGGLIGYARTITDRATFAWVADVIVLPDQQGKGIGRELVRALQSHPELRNLRRWLLATRDAHGVYEPLGFGPLAKPDRWMENCIAAPYGRPTS